MAVYLVDFENVSSAGISGIQKLTKDDKVYIFYTVNASNMSFAAHLNLLSSPAEVVYYNVASGGKNALDFQLASFLGYLICQGKEKKFCIISNDRGFEYVKTFWERNGIAADISISGSPSINRSLLPMEKPFAARIQQNAQSVQSTAKDISEEKPVSVIEEKPAEHIADVMDEQHTAEKVPKRRGRPKGKTSAKTETASKTESAAKTEIVEPAAPKSKTASKPETKSASKAAPKSGAAKAGNAPKTEAHSVSLEVMQTLKHALSKANVNNGDEIDQVMNLLENSDGKQQFYRGILKIFGMERGVEVYKVVRPEYTNLTKLIK